MLESNGTLTEVAQDKSGQPDRAQSRANYIKACAPRLADSETTVADLGREYDQMLSMPGIEDVRVTDEKIVIDTAVIFCRDPRTQVLHELGRYEIHLPLQKLPVPKVVEEPQSTATQSTAPSSSATCTAVTASTVAQQWYCARQEFSPVFFNKAGALQTGSGYVLHAPHVNAGGYACLGNTAETFYCLFLSREYSVAAQMAIAFLEAVNVQDAWGRNIDRWPVAQVSE